MGYIIKDGISYFVRNGVAYGGPEDGGSSGGGSASLNIHYGDTEPSDTSMLWCKCSEPSNVVVSTDIGQLPMTINGAATFDGGYFNNCIKAGKYIYIFPRVTSYYVHKYDLETGEVIKTNATSHTLLSDTVCVLVVLDDNIYIFNGSKGLACMFDTTTDTFTELDWVISGDVQGSAVGVYDNKIYFLGGYKIKAITVFDLNTKQCTTLTATLPEQLGYSGYACFGSKIYIFGGHYYKSSSSKGYRSAIYVFDCETETVTTLTTTLPTNLAYMGSVTLGNKIYLIGGRSGDSTGYYSDAIYVFDVETETVETLSVTLPVKNTSVVATIDGNDIYYVDDTVTMNKLAIQTEVPNRTLHIVPSLNENTFKLIGGNQSVDVGVRNVLLGNADGYGENVDAYLYQNDTWTQI